MTLREFEDGYWYLDDLKDFAVQIGIPEAKRLRKDEIERAIVTFLRTGAAKLPTNKKISSTCLEFARASRAIADEGVRAPSVKWRSAFYDCCRSRRDRMFMETPTIME